MNKSTFVLLIGATIALSGCDDKKVNELTTQLQQKDQTITQLNSEIVTFKSEVEKLQNELKAEQLKNATFRPAITTENETLFEKNDKVKLTNKELLAEVEKEFKNKQGFEEAITSTIHYSVTTLKTNLPWLDELLLGELYADISSETNKVTSKEQFIKQLTNSYNTSIEDAKMFLMQSIEYDTTFDFIGQKDNLATFTFFNSVYFGNEGEADIYGTKYIIIDLDKKSILRLDDLFTAQNKKALHELLWNAYKMKLIDESGNPFAPSIEKEELSVSDNFFFTQDGIHFSYGTYEIGEFVDDKRELFLSWEELNPILNEEYQHKIKNAKL